MNVYLPDLDGSKQGIDDFLASGGTIEQLKHWHATAELRAPVDESKSGRRDRFSIHTAQAMLERPDPAWLVWGMLTQGGTAGLIGEPASFKTFAGLEIAFCVHLGVPYAGHKVKQAPVLYISAEGSAGLKKRLLALMKSYRIDMPDGFYTITEAVNLLDATECATLHEAISELGVSVGLIVIDTLARCMVGGDENSARDMGLAVDALTELSHATGATVLVLHHTTKSTGSIRGSTALPGGLDTIIKAERDGDRLTLSCTKQKDAEEFQPHYFITKTVQLGPETSSLVLERTSEPASGASATTERVLSILKDIAGVDEVSSTDWQHACQLRGTSEAAFKRHKGTLVGNGLVIARKEGRRTFFRIAQAADRTGLDDMMQGADGEDIA